MLTLKEGMRYVRYNANDPKPTDVNFIYKDWLNPKNLQWKLDTELKDKFMYVKNDGNTLGQETVAVSSVFNSTTNVTEGSDEIDGTVNTTIDCYKIEVYILTE